MSNYRDIFSILNSTKDSFETYEIQRLAEERCRAQRRIEDMAQLLEQFPLGLEVCYTSRAYILDDSNARRGLVVGYRGTRLLIRSDDSSTPETVTVTRRQLCLAVDYCPRRQGLGDFLPPLKQ